MSCRDNPSYTSRYGLTCQQHEGLDCSGFAGLGFDPSEVDELLKNCPSACSVDGCGDATSTRRTAASSSTSASNPPPAWARQGQSMRELQANSLDDAEFACYPGWEPTCQDDATFISRLKSPCEAHQQFDCRDTYLIGFSEQQVHELVNACPCSCGIECNTFTLSPTTAPTATPTVPPTPAPTPRTPAPTSEPSSKPSAAPTTAAPTAKPSSTPTSAPSFLPSSVPTAAPSPSPSATPSFLPTSAPTVAPTFGPTISKMPTVAPTISAMPSASMHPSSTPTVPSTSTDMPTGSPTIIAPLDIQNNVATDNIDGQVKGAAINQEQPSGSVDRGAEGMNMNLLIISVGAALIALMIIAVGVVLRKRLSSSRHDRDNGGEDDEEDENFHDNDAKPQQGDGVYGMATKGEPYISPDGVIYTRHEVKSNSRSKSGKNKRSQSTVSIKDEMSGVEVRRLNTLSQYTGTTGSFSEEVQSIHEPIAKISMMNGLRKSKMKKQQKQLKQQKNTAASHAQETDSHFENATRATNGQVVRVQKGLCRGRSRSRSKEGRSHSRSRTRSRSMPRQQANSAGQDQQRGRTRSRSIDSRKSKPATSTQGKSFETSEQRIAEQIQRSRSRSRSRGHRSQSSVPHIEPMAHEPMERRESPVQDHNLGNLPHISVVEADEEARHREHLQVEIGRSRSRSGRSQGGRYSQHAPKQSSAEENPFTFVGAQHHEFETRQFDKEIPSQSPITQRRQRPMPEPLENPNGVPTTIIGKNRKHKRSNSNGQSRGAFMITESEDEADESAVLNSDLFTDSLHEDEEDGTEYTDISAISSRSIRSRIWEQMAKDLAAREAAGMGPPMAPVHE